MAQGCIGQEPEPISCCPQNSFGNAVDPNPAVDTCGAGFDVGSLWENSTDGSWWIMTACPGQWACISGCEDERYYLRALKDEADLQVFESGTPTKVWFDSIDYEYPNTLNQWTATTDPYRDNFTVPYNGIYRITYKFTLNLKGTTLNQTSDFVAIVYKNGVTELGRDTKEVYNSTDNEYVYMQGEETLELVAGDNITIQLDHDSGVVCGGGGCDCGLPNYPACVRSVNSIYGSPTFPAPKAGSIVIEQIR